MAKCKAGKCRAEIYWLKNEKTGASVPVDASSMTHNEVVFIKAGNLVALDPTRHVSHFKTCKAPNRFSRKGKK